MSAKTIGGLREHRRLRGKDMGSTLDLVGAALGSSWQGEASPGTGKMVGLGVPVEGVLPPDQVPCNRPGCSVDHRVGAFFMEF